MLPLIFSRNMEKLAEPLQGVNLAQPWSMSSYASPRIPYRWNSGIANSYTQTSAYLSGVRFAIAASSYFILRNRINQGGGKFGGIFQPFTAYAPRPCRLQQSTHDPDSFARRRKN